MYDSLPKHRIVLLGVGHTNAHILKMWRMRALPDAELICVSNFRKATYSGMLPGVLSGQYRAAQMTIDLVRLCAAARATLVIGNVDGLDPQRQRLTFTDHAAVEFDVLSVGIGSQPAFENVSGDLGDVVPIKPMQTFLRRLDERLRAAIDRKSNGGALKIVVVGGGAGGGEIAMCLPGHLATAAPNQPFELCLVQGLSRLLPGLLSSTAARVQRTLERRGAQIILGRNVIEVREKALVLDTGTELPADVVIWATGATASPLLANLGLPVDKRGFLLTRDTLQSISDVPVFAVGDSGSIQNQPLPKAGVYAVRQGPVLWRNLSRMLRRQPLERYCPQSGFLKLLNQGDGSAIGEYLGRSFAGRWVFRWKDIIDRKFVSMYQDYTPAMTSSGTDHEPEMRCAGCGGKIGGNVLSAVLKSLDVPPRDEVVIGLDKPDDAAVLELGTKTTVTMTTDFFQAPLRDAYLTGRIAALNALSDVWAMGAEPLAALANVVLPIGPSNAQERLLRELLAGSLEELRRAGATLAGGHTIEGPAPVIGFSVLADQSKAAPTTKSNLQPGDRLLLSKSLGTGILLAAHMQAVCRATWMKALVRTLLQSNQAAAALARECGATALTDVTGFGLAGHLLEMLQASQVSAQIDLDALPLLEGVAESLQQDIESTLAAANRAAAEPKIDVDESTRNTPAYRALFDPQTNGGVLFALEPETYVEHEEQLAQNGITAIGRVKRVEDDGVRLYMSGGK